MCRRELDYQHIDPNLYQFCQKVIKEMRVRLIIAVSTIVCKYEFDVFVLGWDWVRIGTEIALVSSTYCTRTSSSGLCTM